MSKTTTCFALCILALAALACNTAAPLAEPAPTTIVIVEATSPQGPATSPASEAEVPRVSLEEARAALESGAAVIVDVRSRESYELSHIPGAIHLPLGEFETNPGGLPLDPEQWIITYCT